MRHRSLLISLFALLVGTNVLAGTVLVSSTKAALPPGSYYIGKTTFTKYAPAPPKMCHKLLEYRPARADNPIGCRFKITRVVRFYNDPVANWWWHTYTITYKGPFGFWSGTSSMLARYNGQQVIKDNQTCSGEAIFIKIAIEPNGCKTWYAGKELVHEVVFKVFCDPCLPGVNISKVYWAQQFVRPTGVVGADMFFP